MCYNVFIHTKRDNKNMYVYKGKVVKDTFIQAIFQNLFFILIFHRRSKKPDPLWMAKEIPFYYYSVFAVLHTYEHMNNNK